MADAAIMEIERSGFSFLSSEASEMELEGQDVSGGPSPAGKWELLGTGVEERMNASLDAVIEKEQKRRRAASRKAPESPSRGNAMRRKMKLDDFFQVTTTSKSPKGTGQGGKEIMAKRNRRDTSGLIASPPAKRGPKQEPFVKRICRDLNEPKHWLVSRVIGQTSRKYVEDLVAKVDAVEAAGGQFVADGSRRRTRGGVFFSLLKDEVSKEQWDKIFEEEKEVLKRKKALKRRIRTTPFSTPRGKTRVPHDDEVEEGQLVEPTTPATPSYKDQLVKAM